MISETFELFVQCAKDSTHQVKIVEQHRVIICCDNQPLLVRGVVKAQRELQLCVLIVFTLWPLECM